MNKRELKDKIDYTIHDNQSNMITGEVLNEILHDIVDNSGTGDSLGTWYALPGNISPGVISPLKITFQLPFKAYNSNYNEFNIYPGDTSINVNNEIHYMNSSINYTEDEYGEEAFINDFGNFLVEKVPFIAMYRGYTFSHNNNDEEENNYRRTLIHLTLDVNELIDSEYNEFTVTTSNDEFKYTIYREAESIMLYYVNMYFEWEAEGDSSHCYFDVNGVGLPAQEMILIASIPQ